MNSLVSGIKAWQLDMSGLALPCQKGPLVSPFYARRVSYVDHEQMEVLIP
jgi:hypothetical protein